MAAAKAGGLDKRTRHFKNVSRMTKEITDKDLKNGIDKTKKLQGAIENLSIEPRSGQSAPRLDLLPTSSLTFT